MAEKTYLQAISDGLRQEMQHDKRVFVIGEDVGVYGGAFKVTLGFQEEFGPWRVIDAPLSETAIVGGCTGAAIMGMRPVAEMQFADFISCAWDHLVTVAAKQRYRAGTPVPSTNISRIRCPGAFGAIIVTSTSEGGTIWLKWMLKPWANISILPARRPGSMLSR